MTSPIGGTASISGLVSGIDTSSLIAQLMQLEARPQALLKTQLTRAQAKAAAYRDINLSFAAISTAATALTQASTWGAVTASSSSSTVSASASSAAQPGSLSFTVNQLAAAHSVVTGQNWTNTTDAFGLGSSLTLTKANGTTTTITVGGSGTLADAVTAINAAGVSAAAVNTGSGYRLQVTATATGAASAFTLSASGGTASTFSVLTQGQNAQITVGASSATTTSYTVGSATNTFTGVLAGTSFTVSQAGAAATVTVATDPAAISKSVQALVTAANDALAKIAKYTDTSTGSTAPLQGDSPLASLASRVLTAASTAVGGSSAAAVGLQLTKDGRITFDSTRFTAALQANPAQVRKILGGTVGAGADGITGTIDDTVTTDGLGARLAVLAAQATDTTAGILTSLAKGQDRTATDLQTQMNNWDVRLQLRQQALTRQFTAMETMLGSLKNQSSWLSGQIASLPPGVRIS